MHKEGHHLSHAALRKLTNCNYEIGYPTCSVGVNKFYIMWSK